LLCFGGYAWVSGSSSRSDFAAAQLALKRDLSFPVSKMWQWWTDVYILDTN